MVRCACSNFKYPLACYATDGVRAELMDTIVWEAVGSVGSQCWAESVVFEMWWSFPKPIVLLPLWWWQAFCGTQKNMDLTRHIYFISIAPHLIKIAKDCLANSGSLGNSLGLYGIRESIFHGCIWLNCIVIIANTVNNVWCQTWPMITYT